MNLSYLCSFSLSVILFTGCTSSHLISDPSERKIIEQDFLSKQQALPEGQLFRIFDTDLSAGQKEALQFLYAYMPVGDITDYSGEFYLQHVDYSLKARQEMPWGKTIPEREFRHFVLPVRVNNENLDSSRMVFYRELKDRVGHLSLYDAVLEVNHWCHEKVTYTPSDARTSSPLASVKTAYGRCGEESTFLVAALRAVGIPARQVYTPRWAHTDDNHAWVEAWVDGKWHFLGACEPEPVLDLGWFNAPASRGMLMHTKVFGRYNGPEEVMSRTDGYTEINVVDNYAPTGHARVKVVDEAQRPVVQAEVEFKIYNYAEFYTVASKQTDSTGTVSLTAGKGDMLIWANDGKKFGFGKLSFGKDSVLTLVLDKQQGMLIDLPIDIVPPAENVRQVEVTPEQRARNNTRLAQEDSIRNAYIGTFLSRGQAVRIAAELELDSTRLVPLLLASRGNHAEIVRFLQTAGPGEREQAVQLLEVISDKDLRDTPAGVLLAHLQETPDNPGPLFAAYVLNPRIATEMLTAYKAFFRSALDPGLIRQIQADPNVWTNWYTRNIRIDDRLNPQRIPMMPEGVWKARVADRHSGHIFYVAVLRSLGIPARIDEVTGKVQFADAQHRWNDVDFGASRPAVAPQGRLTATYTPVKALSDPQYYSHYSLSRFDRGTFRLLNFPEDKSSSWEHLLKKPLPIDTGYYLLVTGTRLANGGVLSNITTFNIREGENTGIRMLMRENPDEVKVIGNFNSEALFLPEGQTTPQSILQTTERGYFIVGILGARQEPTNHALRDIAALKKDFEAWGRGMVLLFPNEQQLKNFNAGEFPALPATITYGIDQDQLIQSMIRENMKLPHDNLPIFIIADTFNRVVFLSQGYTIGLGEQLMKTIHKL